MSDPNISGSDRGLNILCIDGGGACGLSALIILKEIMKRVQRLKYLEAPPEPHECFDLIAGTGTGAVQACMLGRLRMSVDSVIRAYNDLAKDVFSKKLFEFGPSKAARLEDSLKIIIQEKTGNSEEPMIDHGQTGNCKTLVFAMSTRNMRASIPTAFRSYSVAANEGPRCAIWKTLCATMAHPALFKPFTIDDPPPGQSFVDAGLGCNNPLVHVLAEVKTLYPERYVASVTSIGTGHIRTIQIPDSFIYRFLPPIASMIAMRDIARDSERVAEEMARRFSLTKDTYFRLSVDQGMQSVGMGGWEQLSKVEADTHAYMKMVDVNQRIGKAAKAIHSREPTAPTVQIGGEIQVERTSTGIKSVFRRCPAPTPAFTGCELKVSGIESCISGSTTERKVCVVHGLGGAGKTQMVLKVIERTYDQWKEVIYVDASTQESIGSTLKEVAIAKNVGDGYLDALQWLESYREQWLVVFDNADDPSLPLHNYMPTGNHGSIIITTRLSGMVPLARGANSDCGVSSMDSGDALELFLKLARKQGQGLPPEELESAKELLQDFGHLALAIVHAGSYIGQSPHMSFTDYRSLFIAQRRRALEAYSKSRTTIKIEDYHHTTYTTWLMCYESLRPPAQKLLQLIGFLHHTGITIDIFQRAATNITQHEPDFAPTLRDLEHSARQELKKFLGSFLDTNQHWDIISFTESINEITSWSLLEYDHNNQSYRIHVLVQDWARTIGPWEADLATECIRTLLSVSIPLDMSLKTIVFRMSIGPHVDKVLSEAHDEPGPNHALHFSSVYADRWQWERVEKLRMQVLEASKRFLGNDDPYTLTCMHNLASAYTRRDRFEEAKLLELEVIEKRTQVLGPKHADTLSTMHNLAFTYSKLRRFEDAKDLQVKILAAREQVLGPDHAHTLVTMHNLASTYSYLNRLEDTKDLETTVLERRTRVLGPDHPDTLSTMHNLAYTYSKLNQPEKSEEFGLKVLRARTRVLGSDHPHTLMTLSNLADTYLNLGLWEKAEELQIDPSIFARVIGENNGWTHGARNLLQRIQASRETHADGPIG